MSKMQGAVEKLAFALFRLKATLSPSFHNGIAGASWAYALLPVLRAILDFHIQASTLLGAAVAAEMQGRLCTRKLEFMPDGARAAYAHLLELQVLA